MFQQMLLQDYGKLCGIKVVLQEIFSLEQGFNPILMDPMIEETSKYDKVPWNRSLQLIFVAVTLHKVGFRNWISGRFVLDGYKAP